MKVSLRKPIPNSERRRIRNLGAENVTKLPLTERAKTILRMFARAGGAHTVDIARELEISIAEAAEEVRLLHAEGRIVFNRRAGRFQIAEGEA